MLVLTPPVEEKINEYGLRVEGCFGDLLLEDTPEGVRVSLTDEMAEVDPPESIEPEPLFTINIPGLTAENAWEHIGGLLMAVEVFCWQVGDNRIAPLPTDSDMVKALIPLHTKAEIDRQDFGSALVPALIGLQSDAAYHLRGVITGNWENGTPSNYGDVIEPIAILQAGLFKAQEHAEDLSDLIFEDRGRGLMAKDATTNETS